MVQQKLVYFSIACFLSSMCRAQDFQDTEDYSNDSPFNDEPKIERVKIGTAYNLKCGHNHSKDVVWEYKECKQPYSGIVCNYQDLTNTNSKEKADWKVRVNKQRYHIDSLNKSHSGLYRCVEKGVVRKSVVIEVVEENRYDLPGPSVQSLVTSNITNQLNIEFTIQCNVTSVIPPTIIWFKKCYGSKCDIQDEGICYCHLNVSEPSYSIGETHISKMNIFNAKDLDSGLYACLAVTEYGRDYKYVNIIVPDSNGHRTGGSSFSLLFLIPLALVIIPVAGWLCYMKRTGSRTMVATMQQQQVLLEASSSRIVRPTV